MVISKVLEHGEILRNPGRAQVIAPRHFRSHDSSLLQVKIAAPQRLQGKGSRNLELNRHRQILIVTKRDLLSFALAICDSFPCI